MDEESLDKRGKNKDFLENQWKPGQSGNPLGRPKRPSLIDALCRAIENDPGALERIGKSLLDGIEAREPGIVREVLARMDPEDKPEERTDITINLDSAPAKVAEAKDDKPAEPTEQPK